MLDLYATPSDMDTSLQLHAAAKSHRSGFPRRSLADPSASSASSKPRKPAKASSKIHPRTSPPPKNSERMTVESKDVAGVTTSPQHGDDKIDAQLARSLGEMNKLSGEEDRNGDYESLHEAAEEARAVILDSESESLQLVGYPIVESPDILQKESTANVQDDKSVRESNQIEFDGSLQRTLDILTQHLHSEKEGFLFSKGEQVLSPGDCKIAEDNMSNLSCLESAMMLSPNFDAAAAAASADVFEQLTELNGIFDNTLEVLKSPKETSLSKAKHIFIHALESMPWKMPTHLRAYSLVFPSFCIIWYILCTTKQQHASFLPPT